MVSPLRQGSRNLPFLVARKQLSALKANIPTPTLGFALSATGLTYCKETGTWEMSSGTGNKSISLSEPGWTMHLHAAVKTPHLSSDGTKFYSSPRCSNQNFNCFKISHLHTATLLLFLPSYRKGKAGNSGKTEIKAGKRGEINFSTTF